MARKPIKRRGLAYIDKAGKRRNRRGQYVSEEAYKELKAREKDSRVKAALEAAERKSKRRAERKAQVAQSKAQQKRRTTRLKKAGKAPRKAKSKAPLKPQLTDRTKKYVKQIYVWEGLQSLPEVRAFLRSLYSEKPVPFTRATIRAGQGRATESIGTLWDNPRRTQLRLEMLLHSESMSRLQSYANERGFKLFIEIEVLRKR